MNLELISEDPKEVLEESKLRHESPRNKEITKVRVLTNKQGCLGQDILGKKRNGPKEEHNGWTKRGT